MAAHNPIRILCADLSLRCPGFAVLIWDGKAIHVDSLSHLNARGKNITHGELLANIFAHISGLSEHADVFVREKGFSRFAHETQAQYKVVGIADLAAWASKKESYHEIAPNMIKRLITGNGKASKEDVAAALEQYVGRQEYAATDESDAVAAGVAWLLQTDQLKILHSTDP